MTERSQQLTNVANKIGGKYQQVLSKARQHADSGGKQQQVANPIHRQQRSQLGVHNFIG